MARKMVSNPRKNSWIQQFFLVQGMCLLGGAGILSSGMALAQAGNPASPDPAAEVEVPPVAPVVPEVAPLPVAPEFSPAPLPSADQVEAPAIVLPRAKADYDAPSSIVLSERSSGCQTVLSRGQAVPGNICPPAEKWDASGASRAGDRTLVSGLSVVNPSATIWDYYKRTVRPPGRLGNGNIRLIFPLAIPAPISSMFGWRTHPITGDQRFHSGTDLAAPLGTPVLAAFAGRVAIADLLGGYGLAIGLEHNKGTQQTIYAHLSEIFVKPGEWVKQGEAIGRVGSTGNSTGPHLHFEFRQLTPEGWVAMDPGQQLEYALAQLLKSIQMAQAKAGSRS